MTDISIYGEYETAWCPGCGNHDILAAVKQALAMCELPPEKVMMVSGIGQAAKAPHYLNANVFNGLHGRSLPAATAIKLANPELNVIVESGDGCFYGEGGNHFLAAIRRNVNITVLAHDNSIYGLTKGQASPTSTSGVISRAEPYGVFNIPFNPVEIAIALGAGFVARGFSGDKENLPDLIAQAVKHEGLALVDILTPCVSFNKFNTFAWYKEHIKPLPKGYEPMDKTAALAAAEPADGVFYTGMIYKREGQTTMESHFSMLAKGALARQPVDMAELKSIMDAYK